MVAFFVSTANWTARTKLLHYHKGLKLIDRKAKQTTKSKPKAKTMDNMHRQRLSLERNEKRAKLLDWLQGKVIHYFTQFDSTYLFIYTGNLLWH